MTDKTETNDIDRRRFGALMGLAGVAGMAGGALLGAAPAAAQEAKPWQDWVKKFYGKPVKMAVSCAGTTNPYFAPTKAGAEDAGAQLGVDMLWTGVPDGNTVNQIAQFQQLVNTGYEAIVVISSELQEVIGLSHRVMVMRFGRIVGELVGDQITEEQIVRHQMGIEGKAA